jgi:threonine synthase
MNLRDTGYLSDNKVSKDTWALSAFVQDSQHRLIDRLESFEDIINLEVGDTSMTRSRSLERDYDLRHCYVKFEGDNPTGTQKDRIGFAQVYDALRRGFDTIALATCGNYGVAVALAAHLAGLRCQVYIPKGYHTERVQEMEKLGATIFRQGETYEEAVRQSSVAAQSQDWYDANPGGANTSLQIVAYSQIAFEIYDQLRDAPRYCAVPVSNGTLLAGIYRGFESLYKRGKTSRIPRFIAGSSVSKNPIVYSFNKGLEQCVDLKPEQIRETKINEPLINWHSFDGEEALYALRQSQGMAFNITDQQMRKMASYLSKKEAMRVLPAATAGLLGLLSLHEQEPLEADRYVAIVTAKY